MPKSRTAAVVVALSLLAGALPAEWKPAKGPLATRWAKDVSPENAHPEYPRPQMVRKEWLNLNGLWQYAIVGKDAAPPIGKDLPGEILVPYPIESALSGVGKRAEWVHYRRMVTVPKNWQDRRVLLHFQAVDWEATVFVNGTKVGSHRGGYDAFSFDVTEQAKIGQANEIVLAVWDPSSHGPQARGKQVDKPGGIWYTPTTGIWQTAWMEPVYAQSIRGLRIVPDVDAGCLKVTVVGRDTDEKAWVRAIATVDGSQVAFAKGPVGRELTIKIPKPKLWSPDSPFLYDLRVYLYREKDTDVLWDIVDSYFGMRKISVAKDKDGFNRLMLNNKPVFQIGPLDQGFWPDGLYTAPTDEALRYDIEVTKKLGMNMARKHVKIEPQRWYYWCDKLGLLVWQDMPSGNTVQDRPQFQKELTALVTGRGNHPSIVLWVVFNEGWGQVGKGRGQSPEGRKDTQFHVDLVRKLDPSRLVIGASGWTDYPGVGDILDIHRYPGPGAPKPEPKRAGVLGEFGGLGLVVKGHLWQEDRNWGYRNMTSREQLTQRYVDLLRKVHVLKDEEGLSAAVYTQTTDVEVEVNGLMTYDRAMIKPDAAIVADANRGKFPPPPIVKVVVPASIVKGQEWRYTTEKPADGWMKGDFDDKAWLLGVGGFGEPTTPGAKVRTKWKTGDIWLRRTFELKDTDLTAPHFRIHHDEDTEIYVNGVLAAKAAQFTTEYVEIPLTKEGVAALKKGANTLAVHCHQEMGGQYIDVGLVDVIPRPKKN